MSLPETLMDHLRSQDGATRARPLTRTSKRGRPAVRGGDPLRGSLGHLFFPSRNLLPLKSLLLQIAIDPVTQPSGHFEGEPPPDCIHKLSAIAAWHEDTSLQLVGLGVVVTIQLPGLGTPLGLELSQTLLVLLHLPEVVIAEALPARVVDR